MFTSMQKRGFTFTTCVQIIIFHNHQKVSPASTLVSFELLKSLVLTFSLQKVNCIVLDTVQFLGLIVGVCISVNHKILQMVVPHRCLCLQDEDDGYGDRDVNDASYEPCVDTFSFSIMHFNAKKKSFKAKWMFLPSSPMVVHSLLQDMNNEVHRE